MKSQTAKVQQASSVKDETKDMAGVELVADGPASQSVQKANEHTKHTAHEGANLSKSKPAKSIEGPISTQAEKKMLHQLM